MTNGVIVTGVLLVAATLFNAMGVNNIGDVLLGAFGAALVVAGWLWRDRVD